MLADARQSLDWLHTVYASLQLIRRTTNNNNNNKNEEVV